MNKKLSFADLVKQIHYDMTDFMAETSLEGKGAKEAQKRYTGKTMKKGGPLEEPEVRVKREAKKEAAKEKAAARRNLKAIPDPEMIQREARKKQARIKAGRKGRASTMMSIGGGGGSKLGG